MRPPNAHRNPNLCLGRPGLPLLLVLVLAGMVGGMAGAQAPMHARISFDSGGAMVKGSADADWSYATVNTLILPGDTLWVDESGTLEVEMAGGTFLRMADRSKADVVALPPLAVIRGWTGAFYIQRVGRSTGEVIFETPVCKVDVERNSQVRVDVLTDGATTVTVRWGGAVIRTNGGDDMMVVTGQRCYVDPGYLPSDPMPFDRREEDAFDSWNRERARMLAIGSETLPSTVVYKSAPVGMADLEPYGEWVYVDSTHYWRPTVITEYVPYRRGHWSYVPSCGYVWVGDYPFSYVTSHYGRWRHHNRYGWMWTYRDVWGPAWVASVRYGPNFVWCPLDPWDRPVYGPGGYFTVGGLRFGLFGSTYCVANDLFWGPSYVRPCTAAIVRNVPRSEIHIWNINIGGPHRTRVPYRTGSVGVRDYSPRRVIRGPDIHGPTKVSARARAVTLEGGHGRVKFSSNARSRSVRTAAAPSSRSATVRSVRIDREAAAKVPALRNRRVATSTAERNVTGRAVRTSPATRATSKTHTAPTRSHSADVSRTTRRTSASLGTLPPSSPEPTRTVTPTTRTPTRTVPPPQRSVSSPTERRRSSSPPKTPSNPAPRSTPTRSVRPSTPTQRVPSRTPPRSVSPTASQSSSRSARTRSVHVPTQTLGRSASRSSAPQVTAPSRPSTPSVAPTRSRSSVSPSRSSPPSSRSNVSSSRSSAPSSRSSVSSSRSSAPSSQSSSSRVSSSRGRR